METHRRAAPIALVGALVAVVRRDRLAGLAVLTYAAMFLVRPLASSLRDVDHRFPLFFAGLIVTSILWRLRDVGDPRERRFWTALACAWVWWLLLESFYVLGEDVLPRRVPQQVLLASWYLFVVSALEREPHIPRLPRYVGLEKLLAWPIVGLFVIGLMAYYLWAPLLSGYANPRTEPIYYVILDGYLLFRLLQFSRRARTERWRTLFAALALPLVIWFTVDVGALEAMVLLNRSIHLPEWWWNLSFVLVVLAVRMRHLSLGSGREPEPVPFAPDELSFLRSTQTLAFGLAFPLVHLAVYRLEALPAAVLAARQWVVVVCLLFFGILALVQHRVLERRAQKFWLERIGFERKLRDSTKDLRLIVERVRGQEEVKQAEERFVLAFESCPYGLAILNRESGRFLEVNPAFESFFGHSREDLLEHTPTSLGLWTRRGDPERIRDLLAEEEEITKLGIQLRARGGEILRVIFSAANLDVDDELCVLWILRDDTAYQEHLEHIEERTAVVDGAREAISVVAGDGRVRSWNRAAEELFGYPRDAMLGASWHEVLDAQGNASAAAAHEASRQGSWSGELSLKRRDGRTVRLASWWSRIEEPPGAFLVVSREWED